MSKNTEILEMMRSVLNAARHDKGLSYTELAVLASVAVNEVKLLDSSIADMDIITLFRLAGALGVHFDIRAPY